VHTPVVTWTDICHLGVWMLAAMMSVHFPAFVHNVLKHFCYFDSNYTCLPQIVQEDEEERVQAMFDFASHFVLLYIYYVLLCLTLSFASILLLLVYTVNVFYLIELLFNFYLFSF